MFKITTKVSGGKVKAVTYHEKTFLVSDIVKYMATDEDGTIFGYSKKPTLIGSKWRKTSSDTKCECIAFITFEGDFSESLQYVGEVV